MERSRKEDGGNPGEVALFDALVASCLGIREDEVEAYLCTEGSRGKGERRRRPRHIITMIPREGTSPNPRTPDPPPGPRVSRSEETPAPSAFEAEAAQRPRSNGSAPGSATGVP